MDVNKLLKRLQLATKNPDLGISFSNEELTALVAMFLSVNEKTNKLISEGKLQGPAGKDGKTPQPGKDYLTDKQQKEMLERMMAEQIARMDRELNQAISNLQDGIDGEDAEITEEQIEEAARRARALIELPDFQELITMEPEAIRNALELLQGPDRLSIDAIEGLDQRFEELRREMADRVTKGGGLGDAGVRQRIRAQAWLNGNGTSPATLTVSDTAPSDPQVNDLWVQIN